MKTEKMQRLEAQREERRKAITRFLARNGMRTKMEIWERVAERCPHANYQLVTDDLRFMMAEGVVEKPFRGVYRMASS